MKLKVNTAPTIEPVTIKEAKEHLRLNVDESDQDVYLKSLIKAATVYTEDVLLKRALLQQTFEYYLDWFPDGNALLIPRPPLISVTSIIYTDSGGTAATLSSSCYDVDTVSEPGRAVLNYGEIWPSTTLATNNPIKTTFVAGYGTKQSDVPENIKQAMKVMIAEMYENREDTVAIRSIQKLNTIERLTIPYRIFTCKQDN